MAARAGPIRRPAVSAPSATRCRRARGGASPGATGPIRRGKPTSPRSASRRPPTGGDDDSPQNLAALRTRSRTDRTPQTLLRLAPGVGVLAAARAAGASPLGDRTAL